MVDKGIPIHGVGLQAHWNLKGPSYEDIRAAIEKYASLGLEIHLTEMDVSVFNFEDAKKSGEYNYGEPVPSGVLEGLELRFGEVVEGY